MITSGMKFPNKFRIWSSILFTGRRIAVYMGAVEQHIGFVKKEASFTFVHASIQLECQSYFKRGSMWQTWPDKWAFSVDPT